MILQYPIDVINGDILASKYVKLQCQQYLNDIENENLEYYFDESVIPKIQHIISECHHIKGKLAGQPIKTEPWQDFLFYSVYGWKHKKTNTRRYRDVGLLTGKKQGKSIIDSIFAILDMFFEKGGETVIISNRKEQAEISFNNIKEFLKYSEIFSQRLSYTTRAIYCERTGANTISHAGTSKGLNGKNISCGIIDEIAELPNNKNGWEIYNFLKSSMVNREQPILLWTTTAQPGIDSVGYEIIQKAKKVLDGILDEPTWFSLLYEIDEDDDWEDPDIYIKANPNLDVSYPKEELIKKLRSAQAGSIEDEITLKTHHLNIFTEDNRETWIKAQDWNKCKDNYEKYKDYLTEEKLATYLCCGGLDLSLKNDLSVFTLAFWIPDIKKYYLKHRIYVPLDEVPNKMKTDSYLFYKWIKDEWVTAINGPVILNKEIMHDILNDLKRFKIKEIGFDPAKFADEDKELIERKVNITSIRQNSEMLATPTLQFHDSVVLDSVIDNNPVAAWCISNVELLRSSYGAIIRKENKASHKRVDVATASIMAVMRLRYHIKNSMKKGSTDYSQIRY